MMTTDASAGSDELKDVNLPRLILDQRLLLAQALSQMLRELIDKENQHRQAFRHVKLVRLLPSSFFQALAEIPGIIGAKGQNSVASTRTNEIRTAVNRFRQALEERGGVECYGDAPLCLDNVLRSLSELENYCRRENTSTLSLGQVEASLRLCTRELMSLIRIATEVDSEYANEV